MSDRKRGGIDVRGTRITVSGRVQGVGFRYFVVQAAEEIGVRGYARNLPNGDVEIWAEGTAEALDRLTETVRSGPRTSRVTGVTRADGPSTGKYAGFGVRY